MTVNGRFFLTGDLPVPDEPAEMIDADKIKEIKIVPHAFYPPVIPLAFYGLPVIQGVTPSLSCLAEVIRRDAGNASGTIFFIQIKDFRVRPDIGTVIIDVNGDVPDEVYVLLPAVTFERMPLFKANELEEFYLFDPLAQWRAPDLLCQRVQRLRRDS